jgi:uncharacterized membrane protein SpoIIM required for sporulation
MSDLPLRSSEFRRERQASWLELERLVEKAQRSDVRRLSAADLARLPLLYRAALSSLSVARSISLDRNAVEYLESLCARAHACVYGVRRRLPDALGEFFLRRLPRTVRAQSGAVLLALGTVLLGVVAGWMLCAADSERYYAFVGEDLASGRDPGASTEYLRAGLYGGAHGTDDLAMFASFLFTHNAEVGILAFCLGLVAGLPTFLLLLVTGLMMGAFGWLYGSRGLGLDLWGWLLPHGITEIGAVVLCGAGGFLVAYAMVFPGRLSRLDNLATKGREAGVLVIGAVCMLLVAGLIEGIFRQTVLDVGIRYAVALATLLFWAFYFGFVGRRRDP